MAIARAVYFGAKVLILDEPTSALGVKQAGTVLRYIAHARSQGVAVIFITHNPHHAYPIGDRFTILKRGQTLGTYTKQEITRDEMIYLMSGGDELINLEDELCEFTNDALPPVVMKLQLSSYFGYFVEKAFLFFLYFLRLTYYNIHYLLLKKFLCYSFSRIQCLKYSVLLCAFCETA